MASKKVPYRKESKRNVMKDVFTDAGRRAKLRANEKKAEQDLRSALGNPTDEKGKPAAGHLVTTYAASALKTWPGPNRASDFEVAAGRYLERLTYRRWGPEIPLSTLWKAFLQLVEDSSPECAQDFARSHERDFLYCVVGHVQRLNLEYERLPHTLKTVEIWSTPEGHVRFFGVQNDGERREFAVDEPPDGPMLCSAGMKIPHLIPPAHLNKMKRMGLENFMKAFESGKIAPSPRPMKLLTEPTLLNVAPPTAADLVTIRKILPSWSDFVTPMPKRRSNKRA